MKLYGFVGSSRVSTCSIILSACGVEHQIEWVSPEESKGEKFLKLNPLGKIPLLETPEGPISETLAIARHAARVGKKLGGETCHEQALVDQWISWFLTEVAPVLAQFMYQTYGFDFPSLSTNPNDHKKGKETFLKHLEHLNKHLEGKTSIVGKCLTIADYFIVSLIYQPLAFAFSSEDRAHICNVIKLVEAVGATEHFKRWYGKVRFCDHAFHIPKKAKAAAPAEGEKKKEDKKEKQDKPKQEKKKEEDDEDFEKPPKVEIKFPDTQFDLMTFKTFFINEKDHAKALAGFWDQFKEGEWSVYHLKYIKYPGECELVYRTNNLLRVFLSRTDHIRKFMFGTQVIIGDEPTLDIEGVWLIRGPEIFKDLAEIDGYDTYEWNKLDSTKEEHKALVADFWTHRKEDEEKVQGKTIRTFKWIK